MSRNKLPDRRASETIKIKISLAGGKEQKILITIGFDDDGLPKEVFCADFKAGSDLHALIMDACILVSRCLQHGDTGAELLAAMCKGPSIIGSIVAAVADSRGGSFSRVYGPRQPLPPSFPAAAVEELVS